MKTQTIDGIRIGFVRRRYGRMVFTWLWYLVGDKWESYGDPWPSLQIPKKDLRKAIADIKIKIPQQELPL